MKTDEEPYDVDDRGNVVDFYDTSTEERVAILHREADANGLEPDGQECGYAWECDDPACEAWALTHGFEYLNEPWIQRL